MLRVTQRLRVRAVSPFVLSLFFLSGFACIVYQMIWQRVLSMVLGSDAYSVTVLVAAFMAGLGCGNLAGGWAADRLTLWKNVLLFGLCELGITIFAYLSIGLYYNQIYQYRLIIQSPSILSIVIFFSLLWPTFLMGMSLPLIAKALTREIHQSERTMGRLYGINTLGASTGAFVTNWFLIRNFGLESAVHIGVLLNLFCALGAVLAARWLRQEKAKEEPVYRRQVGKQTFDMRFWIPVVALCGFVALSLEIIWFRMLGVIQKSTAFTFGNLLAIFLGGFALGSLLGNRWAARSEHPIRRFFALQAAIPIYSAIVVSAFLYSVQSAPFLNPVWNYFGQHEGIQMQAIFGEQSPLSAPLFVQLYFLIPFVLIGPPTFLMGTCYPFLQKAVQSDLKLLGRRAGWLQASNLFGSTLGVILTSWIFLRFLGTPATLKILLAVGSIFLFIYLQMSLAESRISKIAVFLAINAFCLLAIQIPSSNSFWAVLHGSLPSNIIQQEDGSGVCVIKKETGSSRSSVVYINGLSQSSIPSAQVHLLLGMVPTMLHSNPEEIAIVGLGSGATLFAAGGRRETKLLQCIEIVTPLLPTLRKYGIEHPNPLLESLSKDARIQYTFADGRAKLLMQNKKYDIIEADALRSDSAFSGNLYSYEYFRLVQSHLKEGGLAVTWAPTPRVLNTFLMVFPHVLQLQNGTLMILIGSNEPIVWDMNSIWIRLTSWYSRLYFEPAGIGMDSFSRILMRSAITIYSPEYNRTSITDFNTDLYPKDEYAVTQSMTFENIASQNLSYNFR